MSKRKEFKPRYSLDAKGKNVVTANYISALLETVNRNGLVIYRCWVDLITGRCTKLVKYKLSLSKPEKDKKPLVVFYVPDEDIQEDAPDKWQVRGTVAKSSFLTGRDCIGCEGVRYTKQKHLEIKEQLLLNSNEYKNSRIGKMFKHIKRS